MGFNKSIQTDCDLYDLVDYPPATMPTEKEQFLMQVKQYKEFFSKKKYKKIKNLIKMGMVESIEIEWHSGQDKPRILVNLKSIVI